MIYVLIRKRRVILNFCRFSVGDNKGCALHLGALHFFEGIIYALLGDKKAESKDNSAKNDYFIDGLHIQ